MFPIYRHLQALVLIPALLFSSALPVSLDVPREPIPPSYFGLHIHHIGAGTPWPHMKVNEWRLWDAYVTWPEIEPKKGEWHFAKLDSYVSIAEQNGTGLMLPLAYSPPWATSQPGKNTAPPTNMEDWRNYVHTIVTKYKGRIGAYEIWNEPNLKDFWTGTPDQLVELTKEASQIIHKEDPKAIVVSPSITATYGVPWLADFLKRGVGQYVDVIGYHFYITPKPPEDLPAFIQSVRKVLDDNGLQNKPLWDTETGWLPPSHFDNDEAAAGVLARAYILGWASGVQRFYWYAWDNFHVTVRTTKEDHTDMPAGYAYKVIREWLEGARMIRCGDNNGVWICELEHNGRKERIVWNPLAESKFDVPPEWHVKFVTPLLHDTHPVNGPKIDIGPAPVLLPEG
jgi:hypothetical protein